MHMVTNRNFAPLHETLLFPKAFQKLCFLVFTCLYKKDFAHLIVLSSVYTLFTTLQEHKQMTM